MNRENLLNLLTTIFRGRGSTDHIGNTTYYYIETDRELEFEWITSILTSLERAYDLVSWSYRADDGEITLRIKEETDG